MYVCMYVCIQALISHVNDNEVRDTKDLLWEFYDDQLLGKYQKRNNQPDNPSAHCEKEIEDIFWSIC